MGREKGGSYPPSHHTRRATKERQRVRRLGTSQPTHVVTYIVLSANFIDLALWFDMPLQ